MKDSHPLSGAAGTENPSPATLPTLSKLMDSVGSNPLLITLLTSMMFVLGFAVNSIVFSTWGISFAQFATAWDVLVGGLQIGGMFLSVIIGYWIIVPFRRFSPVSLLAYMLTGVLAISVLFLAAESIIARDTALLVVMLLAGMAAGSIDFHRYKKKWQRNALISISIFQFTIFSGLSLFVQISSASEHGYSWPNVVTIDEAGCNAARALWVGERAIVIRCMDGQVRVLRDSDGATFVVRVDPRRPT